jgi:hypothetical protein
MSSLEVECKGRRIRMKKKAPQHHNAVRKECCTSHDIERQILPPEDHDKIQWPNPENCRSDAPNAMLLNIRLYICHFKLFSFESAQMLQSRAWDKC